MRPFQASEGFVSQTTWPDMQPISVSVASRTQQLGETTCIIMQVLKRVDPGLGARCHGTPRSAQAGVVVMRPRELSPGSLASRRRHPWTAGASLVFLSERCLCA